MVSTHFLEKFQINSLSFVIQDLTYIALSGRLRHQDNESLHLVYSKVLTLR